jgi:hypothetical protein
MYTHDLILDDSASSVSVTVQSDGRVFVTIQNIDSELTAVLNIKQVERLYTLIKEDHMNLNIKVKNNG